MIIRIFVHIIKMVSLNMMGEKDVKIGKAKVKKLIASTNNNNGNRYVIFFSSIINIMVNIGSNQM